MLMNIDDKESTVLVGVEGQEPASNIHLDVSNDTDLVAITFPDAARLLVLKVDDWSNPSINIFERKDIVAHWPTFSPDGNHILLQTINNQATILTVYEVAQSGLTPIDWEFNLDLFDRDKLLITDWY